MRDANVLAAQSIANVVKVRRRCEGSLTLAVVAGAGSVHDVHGATLIVTVGLDKMLVDDIGDVTISNDGATILSLLDVEHPAGRILVELAQQQDKEVGDGTTSVVILAAELLSRANELVKHRIHPTTVITGYRLACKEAIKYLQDQLAVKADTLAQETLMSVAKTSMSSKIIGADDDFFAQMAVEAMLAVKTVNPRGETKYPVKAVNILKAHGKSMTESIAVRGYALNCTVASQAMKTRIPNAKIACLDINLQKTRMNLGVSITIDDPEQLEAIRKRSVLHCRLALTSQRERDHARADPQNPRGRRQRDLDHQGHRRPLPEGVRRGGRDGGAAVQEGGSAADRQSHRRDARLEPGEPRGRGDVRGVVARERRGGRPAAHLRRRGHPRQGHQSRQLSLDHPARGERCA